MKSGCRKFIISILSLVILGGFLFIWFGLFNIAANKKHLDITTYFLEFVRDRSIKSNAEDIKVPDLTVKSRIAKGAPNYAAMCAECHLAPGIDSSELSEGLYPQPPVLYKIEESRREPKETFWIIKNGMKMTGMPAWGIYNSDDQIWDMIALIYELKNMTPEAYQKLVDAGEHTHAKGGHGMDDHDDDDHEPMEKTASKHNDNGHKH